MRKLVFILTLLFSVPALAEPLLIATGNKSGTNSTMFGDILKVCPNIATEITSTSGGSENISMLAANQIDGGIAQVDVAQFLGRTDPDIKELRSLVTLNPNVLIGIVKVGGFVTAPGTTGLFGIGGKAAQITTFTDLKSLTNQTVGAVGSAQITLRIINDKLNLGLNIIDIDDVRDSQGNTTTAGYTLGLAKLEADKSGRAPIAALFAMGGKVVPWVEKLPQGQYNLINVGSDTIVKLGAPYTEIKITYKNMDAFGWATVAVNNELFVANREGEKATALLALRACYEQNLSRIKNTIGTNPAWKGVTDLKTSAWTRFK